MTPRWLPAFALLTLAAVLLFAACGGDDEAEPGADAASGTLNLEQDDFYFEPTQLTADQPVTLKITNKGKAEHTFTVDALKIDRVVPAGAEEDIALPGGAPGSFEYYCRFHHSQMSGTLTLGTGGPASSPPSSTGGGYGGFGY